MADAREAPADAAAPVGPLRVELRVTPSTFAMADRAKVIYAYDVTNVSDAPIDAQLRAAELTIDGKASSLFANSNGNGGFDPSQRMLPPGEHRGRELQLGPAVFKAPGDYTLVLTVLGVSSEPVHVHVEK